MRLNLTHFGPVRSRDSVPLSQLPLLVVLARCSEDAAHIFLLLRKAHLPYLIYQKTGGCSYKLPSSEARYARYMPHNLGRECSAHLAFIVDNYDNLPHRTAFLQIGFLLHMSFTKFEPNLAFLRSTTLPYVALSKNSFEGDFPAPCESQRNLPAFRACADTYWSHLSRGGPETGQPPPTFFRFYANNLFAVTAERIRARPLRLYQSVLDRLEGRAPLLCVTSRWLNLAVNLLLLLLHR